MGRENLQMARKKRVSLDRTSLIVLVVFIVLAIITAIVTFNFVRDLVTGWSITPIDGVVINNPTAQPGGTVTGPTVPAPQGALQPVDSGPEALDWDGNTRVNILLMGLDYRDWEAGEYPRSDTMLLATVDPVTKTAGLLSIPRDLWVNIPGYDYAKINTAYYLGEANKLPGGGPGLAIQTVEDFLGVPIHFYAQVDFTAFVRLVDEIGGVKIKVEEELTIDPVGDSPKVHLTPGTYTLNGELALAYARNRKTDGGDFDRARRTQQVIMAIRDRVLQFNMLPTLVAKAPILYEEVKAGVRTNMTLDQAIRLAALLQSLPAESIHNAVIGPGQVEPAKSPDGLDILIPYPDQIRLVRDEIFSETGGPAAPVVITGDEKELMTTEAARVAVQNGTYTTGLASKTAEYLRGQGFNIAEEGNADDIYTYTTIYVLTGKPYTVNYLKTVMGLDTIRVYNRYDPNATVDIIVAVGSDWDTSNPMP